MGIGVASPIYADQLSLRFLLTPLAASYVSPSEVKGFPLCILPSLRRRTLTNTNSMQSVSECESVVFCGAAASPQGWPPPKPLSPFRRFLIANSISTRHEIPNKFMQISLRPSLLAFSFPQAQAPARIVAPSLWVEASLAEALLNGPGAWALSVAIKISESFLLLKPLSYLPLF